MSTPLPAQPPSAAADASRASPRWPTWWAGLSALAVYVFSAGGHSFWLDSAEFTTATVGLDIPHPPGHPVASLWGALLTLLPFGPLPFRVAVAQALAAALAAAALQRAFARTFAVADVHAQRQALLSLGCVGCLVFGYGYWFQAVRAEVYALQTLLIALALERLVALAADERRDPRALYAAALYLGIGLANHHFMSVLALPAAFLGFWQALRRHGARVVAWCGASGGVGLVSYLYLPLRAASEPAMDLGHPVTLHSFWWVVSARVYARRIGTEATQPLGERFADLTVILAEQFSFVSLPLALLGLYLVARERKLWGVGYVWGSTALIALCGRAWLNPVRNNPDVLGYMLPGFAGYVVLCALACLALLQAMPKGRLREHARTALAGTSLVLALLQLWHTRASASLTTFHATDEFDQLRLDTLPNAAVTFVTSPETAFRQWERAAVEQTRADVDMLPTAFVNYGEMVEPLLNRRPELAHAVRAFQRDAVLTPGTLDTLARARPVLFEPDLLAAWPLFERSVPAGMWYRLRPEAPSAAELAQAAAERTATLSLLQRRLGEQLEQTETRRQLLFCHYVDAVYYASHGAVELAVAAVARGLTLVPEERDLLRLRALLLRTPERFSLRDFVQQP